MNNDIFFTPTFDDYKKSFPIIDYSKKKDFYLLSFVEGKKYSGEIEENIKYFIDEEKGYGDYLSEAHRTPIVSKRLLDLICKFESNIQVIPAPLFGYQSKKKVVNYFILNYLNLLNPIDKKLSKYSGFDGGLLEPVIIEKEVPENINIFRIKDFPYRVFFKKKLALAIHKGNYTGIKFLKTKSI